MMGRNKLDRDMIKEMASLMDETGLTEIEWSEGIRRIRVSRQTGGGGTAYVQAAPAMGIAAAPAPAAAPAATVEADPAKHPGAIKSPMVGTVYLSPKPGEPAFVSVGSTVAEGQTLLVIEAMKTFNPIPAPRAGKLVRILAEDGTPVEYGAVLMIVE